MKRFGWSFWLTMGAIVVVAVLSLMQGQWRVAIPWALCGLLFVSLESTRAVLDDLRARLELRVRGDR